MAGLDVVGTRYWLLMTAPINMCTMVRFVAGIFLARRADTSIFVSRARLAGQGTYHRTRPGCVAWKLGFDMQHGILAVTVRILRDIWVHGRMVSICLWILKIIESLLAVLPSLALAWMVASFEQGSGGLGQAIFGAFVYCAVWGGLPTGFAYFHTIVWTCGTGPANRVHCCCDSTARAWKRP